jgi:PAS domain S-box-containing protein
MPGDGDGDGRRRAGKGIRLCPTHFAPMNPPGNPQRLTGFHQLAPFLLAIATVGTATGLTALIWPAISTSPFGLFYLAVLLTTLHGDTRAGALAAALSLAAANFFFLAPLSASSHTTNKLIAMGIFAGVASLIVILVRRFRQEQLRRRNIDSRLAAIVNSSEDAIISKTLQGVVTSWNPGAERVFGYSAKEAIGQPLLIVFPPERREEEMDILARIGRGESVRHFQTERVRKDGKRIHVSVCISPLTDPSGKITGASKIARDITELVMHERELARQSRLYAALSQINQAIVWTPTRDELLQKVCQVLVEHGKFTAAWIGWHDPATHQLVPVAMFGNGDGYIKSLQVYTDDRPEGRGPGGTAFRTGRPYICNDIMADPTMQPWQKQAALSGFQTMACFPIRLKGEVAGTLNVYAGDLGFFQDKEVALLTEAATDISFALDNFAREAERKQAQVIARTEKQFSDTMIESMPGIVYFYDEQGRFIRWNQNFVSVSGYSAEAIAKMHPLDFFSREDRQLLQSRIAEVFERGTSCVEADFMAKDGHTTPYFFTGRRVIVDGAVCLVGMGVDITERKQAELALRQLNESLDHQVDERTEALQIALARAESADRLKSAFLATMSHELRTPLNSIIGFTGIILQGLAGPLNAEQSKQLGMVRGSAHHLLELINDVLDISKIEAGQLEVHPAPFDLIPALQRVTASVKLMAEKKGVKLQLVLPPSLEVIVSDQRRVEQVLLNLLNNAIKFTDRGSVTLTAEIIGNFQSTPAAHPQPAVRFRVADTGIGIRPADLATLFQPFRQIDSSLTRQHEGTGLGLAICRRLADLLGGQISAESAWGRGSTFTFILPLNPPA